MRERKIEGGKKLGLDPSNLHSALIPMLANSLGSSLYVARRRCPLTLIENDTDVLFVTGDQAMKNLLAGPIGSPSPVRLSLYYPIGPRQALILPDEDAPLPYPARGITAAQVHTLNGMIVEGCHRQVFALTKDELAPYIF